MCFINWRFRSFVQYISKYPGNACPTPTTINGLGYSGKAIDCIRYGGQARFNGKFFSCLPNPGGKSESNDPVKSHQ